MSAATASYDSSFGNKRMSAPVVASMLFHACVVAVFTVGMPYIRTDRPEVADSIPVEIVKVSELTETNIKPASPAPEKPVPKTEDKKPPEKELPKPSPPQVTALTPPKPSPPKRPEPKKAEAKPVEKAPAPELALKPAAAKESPKPPQKPMLTQTEDKQQEDFQSVLRNLAPSAPPTPTSQATEQGAEPSPLAKFSQQLSMSEADALRRQLGECWNLMAGARYAEDLIVDVRLFMNPDRTVQNAEVLDQFRYFRDGYFRAAADSALRAVRNPHCNPLNLPPQKYDMWKVITVTFDPREML